MAHSTKVDNRPSFQFYPKDWLAAPDLQSCSLAAQGLWIKLLCYMFVSPKRGHLLLASGSKLDSKTIAKLCGVLEEEITALLMELETNGVLSINDGIIINRRMVKDQELSKIRSEAGLSGLSKRWHNKYSKPIAKVIANALQTDGEAIAKEEVLVSFNAVKIFEEVWLSYPRRLGKKEALKHFKATVKSDVDLSLFKKALDKYRSIIAGKEEQYIQHGSTWFNNWRDWVDYKPESIKPKTDKYGNQIA